MSEGKSCGNCEHFSAMTSECRRNAPVPFLVMIPTAQGPQHGSVSFWPGTTEQGWCGEYAPDLMLAKH